MSIFKNHQRFLRAHMLQLSRMFRARGLFCYVSILWRKGEMEKLESCQLFGREKTIEFEK